MPLRSGKIHNTPAHNTAQDTNERSSCSTTIAPKPCNTMAQANPIENKEAIPTLDMDGLETFLSNPMKFATDIPELKTDGSNFADWAKALDAIFLYIFDIPRFTQDLSNFDTLGRVTKAIRFLIQRSVSKDLVEMIDTEINPKISFQKLRDNFKRNSRTIKLELMTELLDLYHVQSDDVTGHLSKVFMIFEKLKRAGLDIPLAVQSILVQTLTLPQGNIPQHIWFHSITRELDRMDSHDPRDVQRLVNAFVNSMRGNNQPQMRAVMKLQPPNQSLYRTPKNLTSSFKYLNITRSPQDEASPFR
ncbi:hypothetical protein O181_040180 [Austropuccinia psidii MF-1]|uniref:Uncharacterized protein n=1 Tax=Austropuccinia psidii MF-1 TaxID=1389203 RepID=A0A9Q3DG87_9BASI|nr:hypothetical protein [Austropuccinia psidii MF-1]